MLKIFVSTPMHGKDMEDIQHRIDCLVDWYVAYDVPITNYEVIDNLHHKDVPTNAGRIWHLGESIKMMDEADVIIFDSDYSCTNGCRIEMEIAKLYGKKYFIAQI